MDIRSGVKFLNFSILAAALITGCTPYQHSGIRGGFTDMRYAPDVFRITFRGNAYTTADRAQDFAMLRACELTLNNGYKFFALLDSRDSVQTSTYTTPSTSTTSTTGGGYTTGTINNHQFNGYTYLNATSQTTYYPGQTFIFYKPSSGLMIRTFTEKPEGIPVLDAVFVEQEITERYHIRLKKKSN